VVTVVAMKIVYRSLRRYKYQLLESYRLYIPWLPRLLYRGRFLAIDGGVLIVAAGYAWDGASGPTWDSGDSMRASLVHDAIYQLIRQGILPKSVRRPADGLMRRICIEDGMWRWRALLWWAGVRGFGWMHVKPETA
jgi:hypothetical protein